MLYAQRFCAGLTCLLLAGCSSTDIITKKQMETEARLEQVLLTGSAHGAQLSEHSRELTALKEKSIAMETAMNAFKAEMTAMKELAAAKRPDEAPAKPSATIQVVNPEPAKKDSEAPQQEAYMKAFGIFSANRYAEAIQAFTDYIAAFPESEYAANAQYWIGECHYTQKDYQKAHDAFNTVLDRYPKGKKVPDAMLKIAFSQISLNNPSSAKAMLLKLIETYPKSPSAAKARDRLSRPL